MKVLIIGSGGREHALAWKIAQSPKLKKLYIAPGNPGTAEVGENVDIAAEDIPALVEFAKTNKIDLTIVGPDPVVAAGAGDAFREARLRVFSPTKAAGKIEWSKTFAKKFMAQYDVPTAKFEVFEDYDLAKSYLSSQSLPVVVKASGLAGGKGVTIAYTKEEAQEVLRQIMVEKVFGDAGSSVVIEECLVGQEISIHAICDGKSSIVFPSSQDHKQIYDGDKGPNTGGMGAYAPVPWVTNETMDLIKIKIIDPIVNNLPDYIGCLYPGLMGDPPKVVEYNARFGDPEIQAYVRLIKSDLLELLDGCVDQRLEGMDIEWEDGFAVCVVLAEMGYPDKYPVGLEITGVETAQNDPDVVVFHRNTGLKDNQLVTAGGRVLNVTATGKTLQEAREKAYAAAAKIQFEGVYYRKDIGLKGVEWIDKQA